MRVRGLIKVKKDGLQSCSIEWTGEEGRAAGSSQTPERLVGHAMESQGHPEGNREPLKVFRQKSDVTRHVLEKSVWVLQGQRFGVWVGQGLRPKDLLKLSQEES